MLLSSRVDPEVTFQRFCVFMYPLNCISKELDIWNCALLITRIPPKHKNQTSPNTHKAIKRRSKNPKIQTSGGVTQAPSLSNSPPLQVLHLAIILIKIKPPSFRLQARSNTYPRLVSLMRQDRRDENLAKPILRPPTPSSCPCK